MDDEKYMKLALALAVKGEGHVNPNPLVGAVVVKDSRIIGQGWHEYYGGLHAERNALENCSESPEGAVMYVTLEPCCHYGKTPPCTEAIIKNRISRVVIGTLDVNPVVAGKGVEILRKNGISVTVGVLEDECRRMIKVFRKYMLTNQPYVLMKYAMTMDGKIATYAGYSKWITGACAREHVHRTRNAMTAIMVGVNTVICDNPLLTCRIENGRNPIRIVCDTHLRTPLESEIIKTAKEIPTFIATSCEDDVKHEAYIENGCEMVVVRKYENHLDMNELMKKLGTLKIDSVLLEGGSELGWSALNMGIVDEVHTYIAPKIFGGHGKTPVEGQGVERPDMAVQLLPYEIRTFDQDYMIASEVKYACSQES